MHTLQWWWCKLVDTLRWQFLNQLAYSDMTKQWHGCEQDDERWPSDMLDQEWLRVMYAQLIDSDTYNRRYDKMMTSGMVATYLTCWLMWLLEQQLIEWEKCLLYEQTSWWQVAWQRWTCWLTGWWVLSPETGTRVLRAQTAGAPTRWQPLSLEANVITPSQL